MPEKINELKALYQDLIAEPLDRKQILVLDGLDEVHQWKLAQYLSRKLPDNLKIIVSIRDTGQDWKNEYQFVPDQLTELPLGGIDETGLAEILSSSGIEGEIIAKDGSKLQKVFAITAYEGNREVGADPFYVRVLAEDLRERKLTAENIESVPIGLDAYLDRWWQQIKQLAGDQNTKNLFGTLAVALGYLQRADLETMYPVLRGDWAGDFFDQIIQTIRRFVIGDDRTGYALAHPRLKRYLRNEKRIRVISNYEDNLISYCSKWKENVSSYALNYYVTHLAEANRIDELKSAFTAEWFAIKWQQAGSYESLINDFSIAIHSLAHESKPDYITILALNVARQTALDYLVELPEDYYATLIRLGDTEKTFSSLMKMNSSRGLACKPLIQAAKEFLNKSFAEKNLTERASLIEKSEQLLKKASFIIYLIRFSGDRIEACEKVLSMLNEHGEFSQTLKADIFKEFEKFGRESLSDDPVLSADILAMLAYSDLTAKKNDTKAASLLQEALDIAEKCEQVTDQIEIFSYSLPALNELDKTKSHELFNKYISNPEDLLNSATHLPNPYLSLLKKLNPYQKEAMQTKVKSILIKDCTSAESRRIRNDSYFGYLRENFDSGKVIESQELLNSILQNDPSFACLSALSCADLMIYSPQELRKWLLKAEELASQDDELAVAALVNYIPVDSSRTWQLVNSFGERKLADKLKEFLNPIIRKTYTEPLKLEIVENAGRLIDHFQPEESGELNASLALEISSTQPEIAKKLLGKTIKRKLSELPEGDTDDLRKLLAMAYHIEGNADAAIEALSMMKWISNKSQVLTSILADAAQNKPKQVAQYAEYLTGLIRDGKELPLYTDALQDAARSLEDIMKTSFELANPLLGILSEQATRMRISDYVHVSSLVAFSLSKSNPEYSYNVFYALIKEMHNWKMDGISFSGNDVFFFCKNLYKAAHQCHFNMQQIIEELESINESADESAKTNILCGLFLLYSLKNLKSSEIHFDQILSALDKGADKTESSGITAFMKMLADLTGEKFGSQSQTIKYLCEAITIHSRINPENAIHLLRKLFNETVMIKKEDERSESICELFNASKEFHADENTVLWNELLTQLLQEAIKSCEEEFHNKIWLAAISCMVSTGCKETARGMIENMEEKLTKDQGQGFIDNQDAKDQLTNLSAFDDLVLKLGDYNLAISCLTVCYSKNQVLELLNQIVNMIEQDEISSKRFILMGSMMAALCPLVYSQFGAAGVQAMINQIESFDAKFLKAAELVSTT
ncbi:MAG TPA: hypothetical protein VE978_07020 [Chitinophagales bacterium]|nr:hypothetical protein [Chitinophagales bacterium]